MFYRLKETQERVPANRYDVIYIEIDPDGVSIDTGPLSHHSRIFRYWQIDEFLQLVDEWKKKRGQCDYFAIEYTHENIERIDKAMER